LEKASQKGRLSYNGIFFFSLFLFLGAHHSILDSLGVNFLLNFPLFPFFFFVLFLLRQHATIFFKSLLGQPIGHGLSGKPKRREIVRNGFHKKNGTTLAMSRQPFRKPRVGWTQYDAGIVMPGGGRMLE
jgi:hypothetical protein